MRRPGRGGPDARAARAAVGPRLSGRRLRCAVVGLGRIGSTLEDDRLRERPASHAGAIHASRDCLLAGGCDTSADRRQAFARRWRCPHVYGDLEAMLEAQNPDILHIATPAGSHGVLIATAVRRGVPLIVCEKPLCPSAEEARRALAACRAGRTTLMVNHERRYSRDYLRARELTRERRYGALLSISARLYMGRGQPPADILLQDGTHMIDVIRFLAGGEIESAAAQGDPHSPEDSLQVLFCCGPARGCLEISGLHEALAFELELGFAGGRLRIGNGVYEEWVAAPSRFYEGFRSLRRVRVPSFRPTGYFSGMLADAVAVAKSPGREPVSSGLDGLRALEVIESLLPRPR